MVNFAQRMCLYGVSWGNIKSFSAAHAVETTHHVAELDYNENTMEGTPVAKILSDDFNFPRQASDEEWGSVERFDDGGSVGESYSRRLGTHSITLKKRSYVSSEVFHEMYRKDLYRLRDAGYFGSGPSSGGGSSSSVTYSGSSVSYGSGRKVLCGKGFTAGWSGRSKMKGIDFISSCAPTPNPTALPTPAPTNPIPTAEPTTLLPTPAPTSPPTPAPTKMERLNDDIMLTVHMPLWAPNGISYAEVGADGYFRVVGNDVLRWHRGDQKIHYCTIQPGYHGQFMCRDSAHENIFLTGKETHWDHGSFMHMMDVGELRHCKYSPDYWVIWHAP